MTEFDEVEDELEEVEDEGDEFYGAYNYDNIAHLKIEESLSNLIREILSEQRKENFVVENPRVISDMSDVLDKMVGMAAKYDILDRLIIEELDDKGEPWTLDNYYEYVATHDNFPTFHTRKILSQFSKLYRNLMGKIANMRKGKVTKLNYIEQVKKKLQFAKWTNKEQEFIEKLQSPLRICVFMMAHYLIIEDGEIHMLMSGDNRSGKTSTSIIIMMIYHQYLKTFYRPIIQQQLDEGKYIKMNGNRYTNFDELVKSEFRTRDHMILNQDDGSNNLFMSSPFPFLIYDEGNFTGLNLKSFDREAIERTQMAFSGRNKHAFIIYNYQNSNRPTLFLREKVNIWFHKIHLVWGLLFIRQRVMLQSKDSWRVKDLEKLTSGEAIYNNLRHHPYLIREFKHMRDIPAKTKKTYDKLRQQAQYDYLKASRENTALTQGIVKVAKEINTQVNNGILLYSDIQNVLLDMGITNTTEQRKIKNAINALMTKNKLEEYSKVEGEEE